MVVLVSGEWWCLWCAMVMVELSGMVLSEWRQVYTSGGKVVGLVIW
jgi:hypothetical protein